jgi:hypothetical protein
MNAQLRAASAECRSVLADGRVLTICATRRARANRADVKCIVPDDPTLAEAMQSVVRLARLSEARSDSREQVLLSMDVRPAADERNWELAAVLADRMVRGLWQPPAPQVAAAGWSDHWQWGELTGDASQAAQALRALPGGPCALVVGGAQAAALTGDGILGLCHLGGLHGHPNPRDSIAAARAWFPLHSGGINDSLAWVEVSVAPLASDAPAGEEEDSIAAPGLDLAALQAVRLALCGARHGDGHGLGRWQTVVRFSHARFQGNSYELALVMADRLARGRDFVPRGRLIASGCSAAWHLGRVDTVAGLLPKCALILRQAGNGDRVLLPKAWQDGLPDGFTAALTARGASLACVERIGLI